MDKRRLYEKSIIFARYFIVTVFLETICCLLVLLITGKDGFASYATRVTIPLCSFISQSITAFLLNPQAKSKKEDRRYFRIPFIASFVATMGAHFVICGFSSLSKILFIFLYAFCGMLGALFGLKASGIKN